MRAHPLLGCLVPGCVSIDNGLHVVHAEEFTDEQLGQHWEALVHSMDDIAREQIHAEMVGASRHAFLARYLEVAPHDLVIG